MNDMNESRLPQGNKLSIGDFLHAMLDRKASDLHIIAGAPPSLRVAGELIALGDTPLTAADTQRICYSILSEAQRHQFEKEQELDISFGFQGRSRFRANFYRQRGSVAAAIRVISRIIPALEELGLPPAALELSQRRQGLVLVTGPAGSGKSTTLAAIVDRINQERRAHIVTIEEPIEYLHAHKQSLVSQREVPSDTTAYHLALKYLLRQDPDVVVIGEMRDLETISAALTLAETGHLTFGTLHTGSAPETLSRILDVYPPGQQRQVRTQLASILEAILAQRLLPKAGGGRVLVAELLLCTPPIRALIREGNFHLIPTQMELGKAQGMQTMNTALLNLLEQRLISWEDAVAHSPNPDQLRALSRW
jgi:twitching motility protein PilT